MPRIIAFLGYVPWDGMPRNLGEKIARARKWLGITQEDLAKEIGVDPGTLARWEKGRGRPSEKFKKIAKNLLGNWETGALALGEFVRMSSCWTLPDNRKLTLIQIIVDNGGKCKTYYEKF